MIKIGSNFDYQGPNFDFGRQFAADYDTLKGLTGATVPDGYEVFCPADGGHWYVYREANTVDAKLGKCRLRPSESITTTSTIQDDDTHNAEIPNAGAVRGYVSGKNFVSLDKNGKVPVNNLPATFNDNFELIEAFVTSNPTTGMTIGQKWYNTTDKKVFTATSDTAGAESDPNPSGADTIYIDKSTNIAYYWSGTDMVPLATGGSLVLGETASTAYRGDRGKELYDEYAGANKAEYQKWRNFTKGQDVTTELPVGELTLDPHSNALNINYQVKNLRGDEAKNAQIVIPLAGAGSVAGGTNNTAGLMTADEKAKVAGIDGVKTDLGTAQADITKLKTDVEKAQTDATDAGTKAQQALDKAGSVDGIGESIVNDLSNPVADANVVKATIHYRYKDTKTGAWSEEKTYDKVWPTATPSAAGVISANDKKQVDKIADIIKQVFPFNISEFTATPNLLEVGATSDVKLDWAWNLNGTYTPLQSQAIGTDIVANDTFTKTYTDVTKADGAGDVTYTLKGTDINGTVVTKDVAVSFHYATYFGAVDAAPTTADTVKALAKTIEYGKGVTKTIDLDNQKSCIAYPKDYGELVSIKDANNFDYIDSYDKAEVDLGSKDTPLVYLVYTLKSPTTIKGFKQVFA